MIIKTIFDEASEHRRMILYGRSPSEDEVCHTPLNEKEKDKYKKKKKKRKLTTCRFQTPPKTKQKNINTHQQTTLQ